MRPRKLPALVAFLCGIERASQAYVDPIGSASEPAVCDKTFILTGLGDRLVDFIGLCTFARSRGRPLYSVFAQVHKSKSWPATCDSHACREYDIATLETPRGCHLIAGSTAEAIPEEISCDTTLVLSGRDMWYVYYLPLPTCHLLIVALQW